MLINYLFLVHAVLTAAAAWLVGGPLKEGGQLLHPLYRRAYGFVERRFGPPEDLKWWQPIWGCRLCMAGQWCFWMYLVHVRFSPAPYHFYEHVYAVAVGLLTCLSLSKHLD